MKCAIEIDEARYKDIQRIASVQLEMNHFQTAEQIIAKGVPIEQEPKSEWQKDHEILKAYSDGVNEVLDNIRFDLYKLYNDRPSDYNHSQRTELFCEVIKILDKYKAESAHDVAQEIVKNNGVVDL